MSLSSMSQFLLRYSKLSYLFHGVIVNNNIELKSRSYFVCPSVSNNTVINKCWIYRNGMATFDIIIIIIIAALYIKIIITFTKVIKPKLKSGLSLFHSFFQFQYIYYVAQDMKLKLNLHWMNFRLSSHVYQVSLFFFLLTFSYRCFTWGHRCMLWRNIDLLFSLS